MLKKCILLSIVVASVAGFGRNAWAFSDYYELSQYGWAGSEYDVASYGNTVYWKNANRVWSVDVAVADMSKVDEPRFLADGVTPNPDFQARTFSNPRSLTLSGPPLLGFSFGEMYVDSAYIYGGATNGNVYQFDKATGAFVGTAVNSGGSLAGGWGVGPTLLSYGGGRWWAANENSRVYSSTGGPWTYEFTWPDMAGGHGDGMEYVNGHVFVSDMTSNFIAMWDEGPSGWAETERFAYTEIGGATKPVEGMGFGALGHFWAGSGVVVYELGGGSIGGYTNPVVPVPGAFLLGILGLSVAGVKLRRFA